MLKKGTGTVKYKKDKLSPISPELLPIIKQRVERSKSGYLFENSKTGRPRTHIWEPFQLVCAEAGIKDFRLHDLKHTFATYALFLSNDQRGVQELCGHSTPTMMARYAHVLDERKKEITTSLSTLVTGLMDTI
jgi:integrase